MIESSIQDGNPMVIESLVRNDYKSEGELGIYTLHAYSIVGINNKTISLYNPYGRKIDLNWDEFWKISSQAKLTINHLG